MLANLSDWCHQFDRLAVDVIRQAGLLTQPDSRAFGGHVEKGIRDSWPQITAQLGCQAEPTPGRRSIYDLACSTSDGDLIGLDIKTKDLADGRYSDGGVCSVANLLRWYQGGSSTFVVAEFGHRSRQGGIAFEYVATAPFHILPPELYRIENLGTGQVRLNGSLAAAKRNFEWDRPLSTFLELFCELAAEHYRRVSDDALRRAGELEEYVASGFSGLRLR
jgi:hypothetical protein